MNLSRYCLILIITSMFALGGCADLMRSVKAGSKPKNATVDDVKAAQAKGDYKAVKDYCLAGKTVAVLEAGCQAAVEMLVEKKDAETLKAICHGRNSPSPYEKWRDRDKACDAYSIFLAAEWKAELSDCAKVTTIYERHSGQFNTLDENYYTLGKAIAKCGHWEHIWTKLVHHGRIKTGRGVTLLSKLSEDGQPVMAELMKYLEANKASPFSFKRGDYATNHALTWVIKADKVGDCKQFIPYAKNASDKEMGHWLGFFADTICRQAAPLAVKQLKNERPLRRQQACAVLGKIGKKKHLKKLKILAKTDPAFRIKKLVKIFWVRDSCLAAMGQIKLR